MIFVDTSALYALLDRNDANHPAASKIWNGVLDSGEELLTSNYVIVEAFALVQNRLGWEAVRSLENHILPLVDVEWMNASSHAMAIAALLAAGRRKLSLVDCSSFVQMRARGISRAFAFDRHFRDEGFEPMGAADAD